jgi:hypothetical protein
MPLIDPSVSHSTNVTTVAHACENVRELTWGKRAHAGGWMRSALLDGRAGFPVERDDHQSEDSGQKRRKIEKPSRVEVGHCQSGN